VLRTDVKSYYASIDHLMLLDQLAISIPGAEAAVIRHVQKRIPYVLFVPEADAGAIEWGWRAPLGGPSYQEPGLRRRWRHRDDCAIIVQRHCG
jgi:hypothetical protein